LRRSRSRPLRLFAAESVRVAIAPAADEHAAVRAAASLLVRSHHVAAVLALTCRGGRYFRLCRCHCSRAWA